MSNPILVAHRGAPCDPPVVDGIPFAPHAEDPDLFIGSCDTEEQAAEICRVPAFTRFGGDPNRVNRVPDGIGDDADCAGDPNEVVHDFSRPVPQWTNPALLAKAQELHLDIPGDAKRGDLVKLVSAALKEPDSPDQPQA